MGETFGDWLAQFTDSHTPLGDLARLASDPAWPVSPDRFQTYVDYLEQVGGDRGTLYTLTDAWIGYASQRRGA
ncbi:YozE family protein [Streptomyces sp. NPDC047981]|uniref:YozE family protein n=1 Tax=Streptomyces sp. NPDC047981 TaxID=3154610 RepID=UPI00341DC419